jgi:hypothetical protein
MYLPINKVLNNLVLLAEHEDLELIVTVDKIDIRK